MNERNDLRETVGGQERRNLDQPDDSNPIDRPMTVVIALGVVVVAVAALLLLM